MFPLEKDSRLAAKKCLNKSLQQNSRRREGSDCEEASEGATSTPGMFKVLQCYFTQVRCYEIKVRPMLPMALTLAHVFMDFYYK